MPAGRARKGGEVGRNGEFYKGGSFLPSTQLPKRGSRGKGNVVKRVLIRPGVLDVIPEGTTAVFPRIREFVQIEDGRAAQRFPDEHVAIQHHFDSPAELHRLIDLYNAGTLFE
ncbi:hypothetical protein [Paraburkholderia phytofirmans]|uniref:Uncharacterized protein n=1 Tax=Paraburkholderia phytofirmans (strain DSM 17436 / LMG 22146 / PsJN) TaxID=398527 RepID=B2TH38_PARPJ|nr:hypothetical protein [Paraburkholderia phytofirmans]ACD21587.1 hypothetical protein Bphyt_7302 [Paraburkholderia phytofirmans PsJN]